MQAHKRRQALGKRQMEIDSPAALLYNRCNVESVLMILKDMRSKESSMENAIRIQKVLSEQGVASRRKVEEWITEGKIKVNGRPATLGQKINPNRDVVTIDGERVYFQKNNMKYYIMLHKPRGYVTTMSDELGRKCVAELVEDVPERVYPIGRLDKDSEGMLLFTNDGEFANFIMHPSHHISKTYRVTVRPDITDAQVVRLSTGVEIDGKKTSPAHVTVLEKEPGRVVLQMVIYEGRNRQVRKMCEAVGLEVARLKRTAIGPLKLGMLAPGKWRELRPGEIGMLRNAVKASTGAPETLGDLDEGMLEGAARKNRRVTMPQQERRPKRVEQYEERSQKDGQHRSGYRGDRHNMKGSFEKNQRAADHKGFKPFRKKGSGM